MRVVRKFYGEVYEVFPEEFLENLWRYLSFVSFSRDSRTLYKFVKVSAPCYTLYCGIMLAL